MKKQLIHIAVFVFCMAGIISCQQTMGDPDNSLSTVAGLIEPADGKTLVLDPSPSASLYFEWDYADVATGGTAVYQIAFDRADGDFSNPVYILSSDNNGFSNNVTLTHKVLNSIAGKAGIAASETGTLKWTVFSSKGLKAQRSSQENTISITRLAGFADLPIDVWVTGEASEGGTDLSKGFKMKAVAGGEFEAYTKLSGGKPFYFVDALTSGAREFYTLNGLIKENSTSTVAADGVYRITLDFNTGACTYTLVTRMGFYFSPSGAIIFDLPYIGGGIWQKKATVEFKQESWGRDERYKFRMFVREDGGTATERELEWATLNGTDSRPTATSPESYYYMLLIDNLTQWDNKWKLMGDFDSVEATYTIYLTADQPYTHSISK
jgi:hypothetical protein